MNRAAQELSELSLQIEEAERNADLECSLIGCQHRAHDYNNHNHDNHDHDHGYHDHDHDCDDV